MKNAKNSRDENETGTCDPAPSSSHAASINLENFNFISTSITTLISCCFYKPLKFQFHFNCNYNFNIMLLL